MARTKSPARAADHSTADLIAGLETTKSSLEARLPALEAAKTAALERRRDALISGGAASDEAQAARAAEDDLAAVADALAEVDRRLAAAHERRDAETAHAEREDVAAGLEADAAAVVEIARKVHEAVAALHAITVEVRKTVTGRGSANADPHHLYVRSPVELAQELVRHGLAEAMPFLEIRNSWGGFADGKPAQELGVSYAANLSDLAAQVRAGAASIPLREHVDADPIFEPRRHERQVWVVEPIAYQTDRGERLVDRGFWGLRTALAEHLLQHNLATLEKPANFGSRREHDARGPEMAEYRRIAFNLSDWERADVAEQLAEWRADLKEAA